MASRLTPPLPASLLYLDPTRALYDSLGLYKGAARTFANPATPAALSARGWAGLAAVRDANANYRPIEPVPGAAFETYTQQGGVLAVDGGDVVYAWRDGGTADHAPIGDVMRACGVAEE